MRIISKFKDYYDSCMYYGMDKDLVYARHVETKNGSIKELLETSELRSYESNKTNIYYAFGNIGFCGKFYPYIKFERGLPTDRITQIKPPNEVVFCYNFEQVEEYMNSFPYTGNFMGYYRTKLTDKQKRHYPVSSHLPYQYWNDADTLENYFNKYTKQNLEPFFEHKTPIIIAVNRERGNQDTSLKTNISLKEYQFYRMFDAFKAFQEISMFLGGVMPRTGKETVILSDVMKRDKHGFDNMSFKTYSPGKKANRKNK